MSLNASLNTALTGLQVNQSLMRITSNNIANADTEGYTRKQAQLGALYLDSLGTGVRIEDVTRTVDTYLIKQAQSQTSVVTKSTTLDEFYTRLQDLFGTPQDNSSMAGLLNSLQNTLEALATDPQQSVAQFTAVTSAQDLVNNLHILSETIQSMRQEVDQQIGIGVTSINTALETIDGINVQVVRNLAIGEPVGDLLDSRDAALSAIAEQIDIKWFTSSNGSTSILTGSNYTLLDNLPHEVQFTSPSGISKAITYPNNGIQPIAVEGQSDDITTEIRSGRIKALIDLRDTILTGLQDQIDNLTSTFAEEINRAHSNAMPVPPLQTFTGLRTTDAADLLDPPNVESIGLYAYDNGTTTSYGTIQFAIVDENGTAVGDGLRINLDEFKTQMENYVSTATGSPFTYQLTIADIINMVNGAYAATPPAGTVVTNAPAGWPVAVTWPPSPALIMPSTGSDIAGLTNMSGESVAGAYTGGAFARVVNGALEIGIDTTSGYGIAIDDSLTTFSEAGETRASSFNYLMGLNNLFVIPEDAASSSLEIEVRSDIATDPGKIGRGTLTSSLRVTGDPSTEYWYVGRGDGSGASNMADIFNNTILFSNVGGLPQATQRLTEYAASIIQYNSTSAENASTQLSFDTSLMTEYENRIGQVSGVNIDEELANLVKIQNAYAASSRVFSTINDMYGDLFALFN